VIVLINLIKASVASVCSTKHYSSQLNHAKNTQGFDINLTQLEYLLNNRFFQIISFGAETVSLLESG